MMPHPEIRQFLMEERVKELRAAAVSVSRPRRTRRSPRTGALALAGASRSVLGLLRRRRPVPAYWTE